MDKQNSVHKSYYKDLKELFELARKRGGYNYIFTLLRMKGITYEKDPFLVAKDYQHHPYRLLPTEDFIIELLDLIANLFSCSAQKPFQAFPFFHLYTDQFPNMKKPSIRQMTEELFDTAKKQNVIEVIKVAEDLKEIDLKFDKKDIFLNYKKTYKFIDALLRVYFGERQRYKKDNLLYRLPNFMVLELLLNNVYGLYGFKFHFSTGSHAFYERTPISTMSMGMLSSDVPVNFFIGDSAKIKNEWMIGEKKMYEVGIPGRYNTIGEWIPIIVQGSADELSKRAHEMAEGDDEVEGTLFYIMCTGHRGIEFAAKTPIELPLKGMKLGEKMHLWKLENSEIHSHASRDLVLYDGYYQLDQIDPKSIRSAIATINVGLNRLAFAYNSSVDWCIKYRAEVRHHPPQPTPSKNDLKILNSLLVDFPTSQDAILLDIAIDWYHRAEIIKRKNPFVAFLCYYIALETVAISVAEGDADLGLNFQKETKSERKKRIIKEIKNRAQEFDNDPIKFIREGYFEYIVGLKEKTRKVAEQVFGKEHENISLLFDDQDKNESLYNLRGKLAHGGITLLDNPERKLIEEKLQEMSDITRSFLKRIIFLLKPEEKLPKWSGRHKLSIFPSDPRDTKVASDLKILGNSDWKIKPEWLD